MGSSHNAEPSSVPRAHHFIVNKDTSAHGSTEVGAVVADRMDLSLVTNDKHLVIIFRANLKIPHLSLSKLISEANFKVLCVGLSEGLLLEHGSP